MSTLLMMLHRSAYIVNSENLCTDHSKNLKFNILSKVLMSLVVPLYDNMLRIQRKMIMDLL